MLLINQEFSTNPYFNLALEEVLFKDFDDDILMLWRNENSIIVGKHQNALAEINLSYALTNKIDVVRRLSGGGTVYHDLGNLNFTFIKNGRKDRLVNFDKFLAPIIRALNNMGLDTYQGKRNEIMLDGKKISGNAEHTFKSRVLHHGTLLFESNLKNLVKSLRINPLKYQDKAIKSVQSRVTNIKGYLENISFADFRADLVSNLQSQFEINSLYNLDEKTIKKVEQLSEEKYQSWEWNFGYSPTYSLHKEIEFEQQFFDVQIRVKKGLIEDIQISGDISEDLNEEINQLLGKEHRLEVLKQMLKSDDLAKELL